MIVFTIPGIPVPKGRPRFRILFDRAALSEIVSVVSRGAISDLGSILRRVIRVQTYTPKETEVAEEALRLCSVKYRPRKPLSGPIRVDTVFVVPMPARLDADRSKLWPHVKPDDDNYRKLVLDALNRVFWGDDGQVCMGVSAKVYGLQPRTWIRIMPLTVEMHADVLQLIGEAAAQPSLFGG